MGRSCSYNVDSIQWKKITKILFNEMIDREMIIPENKCEICGIENVKLNGHHYDYTSPYDVLWLCHICHRKVHAEQIEQIARDRKENMAYLFVYLSAKKRFKFRTKCIELGMPTQIVLESMIDNFLDQ